MVKIGDEEVLTPECDRAHEVHEHSQIIGEFLDWLFTKEGVELMKWNNEARRRPCTRVHATRQAIQRVSEVNGLLEIRAELDGADPSTVVGLPNPEGRPHPDDCECHGTGEVVDYNEALVPYSPDDGNRRWTGGSLIERVLAWYFIIDQAQMEDERRAVLAALGRLNAAEATT